MKKTAFALALLLGGAAFAQSDMEAMSGTAAYDGDGVATLAWETDGAMAYETHSTAGMASDAFAASGAVVQPSNADPERDARGIAVISDPATVPAGWNGTEAGTALGGPELDPATGEPAAAQDYPACTRTVTDNCLQTYEKGRSAT